MVLVGDNSSKIPPLLPVSEFFLARAPEVVKLYNSMEIRNVRIPNHKRRRVKSYKPYWMNAKFSKNSERISRRTQRLHRLYLNNTPREKRRLALTHVWHAKRFHMEDIWGMRLAGNVCDKGRRAIARLGEHECLLHDRSYLDCWELEGTRGSSKAFTGSIGHEKVVCGDFVGTGNIIDADSKTLCPYQVIWVGNNRMNLWTHPSVRTEVAPLLTELGAVLNTERIRFELLGARSLEKLISLEQFITDCPISLIPGRVLKVSISSIQMSMIVRAKGKLIDLLFPERLSTEDKSKVWNVWLQLVQKGSSAIGIHDRHSFIVEKYLSPDFPFDFPSSRAGTRQAAIAAKALLEEDQKRPTHCKMNAERVESPFFPDWSLVDGTDLKHAVVDIVGKGAIEWNAHIYKDGILIGFVTSVCGNQQRQGIASITGCILTESVEVKVCNPKSSHFLIATVRTCFVTSSDSIMVGYSTFT